MSIKDELYYALGLREVGRGRGVELDRAALMQPNAKNTLAASIYHAIKKEARARQARETSRAQIPRQGLDEEVANAIVDKIASIITRLLYLKLLDAIEKRGMQAEDAALKSEKAATNAAAGAEVTKTTKLATKKLAKRDAPRRQGIGALLARISSPRGLEIALSRYLPDNIARLSLANLSTKPMALYKDSILNDSYAKGAKLGVIEYIIALLDRVDFMQYVPEMSQEALEGRTKEPLAFIDTSLLASFYEPLRGSALGSHYTPALLSEFISYETIQRLLASALPILGLSILDLALGCGDFLLYSLRALVQRMDAEGLFCHGGLDRASATRLIIEGCLFGIDIDPRACEIASLRLGLELSYAEASRVDKEGRAGHLVPNLYHANALSNEVFIYGHDSIAIASTAKDTYLTPFVSGPCAPLPTRFDAIIGNPPYIQLSSMHFERALFAYYKESYESYEKEGDIYGLFLERALSLIKPSGIVTQITSSKYLRARYGAKIRSLLRSEARIEYFIDLGPMWFSRASVETAIISFSKKMEDKRKGLNPYASIDEARRLGDIKKDTTEPAPIPYYKLPISLIQTKKASFGSLLRPKSEPLAKEIEPSSTFLCSESSLIATVLNTIVPSHIDATHGGGGALLLSRCSH